MLRNPLKEKAQVRAVLARNWVKAEVLLLFGLLLQSPLQARISVALLGFKSEGASLQKELGKELFRHLDAEKHIDVYPARRIDSLFSRYDMASQEMARFQLPFLLKKIPAHVYVYGKMPQEVVEMQRYWWMPLWGRAKVRHQLHLTVLDGLRGEYRFIGTVEGSGWARNIYMGWHRQEKIMLDPMRKHEAALVAVKELSRATARAVVLSSRGIEKLSDSVAIPSEMNLPQIQFKKAELPDSLGVATDSLKKVDTKDSAKGTNTPNPFNKAKENQGSEGDDNLTRDVKPEKQNKSQEGVGNDDPPPEEFLLLQEGMKW